MSMRSKTDKTQRVAVIGSGPAGLMAASVISDAGYPVIILEKRPGPARKLLIAGSSGLNLTFDAPGERFHENYSGPEKVFRRIFERFSPKDWLRFVNDLGIKTFKGSGGRYFIETMKAPPLLNAWIKRLQDKGVTFQCGWECSAIERSNGVILLRSRSGEELCVAAVCFALGGASYEPDETPLRWPALFERHGITLAPFESSNSGFHVTWPETFLREAEGLPLKNITLSTARGARTGELVVTSYGIEGTPVYAVGKPGPAQLDLKPELTPEQIREKLSQVRENLSPIRRVKKKLNLCDASLALLFHLSSEKDLSTLDQLITRLKHFPITLEKRRPLTEAISSSGGVQFENLDDSLMLKTLPGVFLAGEMLDWDAPTGGFLIQACVSQGHFAGQGIVHYLKTLEH